jgi:acetylornithine/succinyldiaminopimelate/putrescine aminotransferase
LKKKAPWARIVLDSFRSCNELLSIKNKSNELQERRIEILERGDMMTRYTSDELMKMEHEYGAHNYHPLEVVISKAEGIWVEDPEGRRYMDMLSAYSAVNQGHRHPKIIKALKDQADILTLTSRAFFNDKWPIFAKKLSGLTGKEMILPMNTGAEAVETAIKTMRNGNGVTWSRESKRTKRKSSFSPTISTAEQSP